MSFDKEFKEAISHLADKEKDKLILRLLKRDDMLANRLYFELVSTTSVEEQRSKMEERVVDQVKTISSRFYSLGYLNIDIRYLSGEITEHVKITKDKFGEASLNLLMLNEVIKRNHDRILNATHGKARKLCVALVARVFKVLLLINKMHEDLHLEFEDSLKELGELIGNNPHLMKIAINNGLDVNWLFQAEIPEDIVQHYKELRQNGFLK
jgi:hypothetical protein